MMWKVGDKVKFVREGVRDSKVGHGLILGKVYKIIEVVPANYNDVHGCYYWEGNRFMIRRDDGDRWYIEPRAFKLMTIKPKNEIEFLDAFKNNFEDGF